MTTTPSAALRARYLNDAVTTAGPAQLLVMLYDRLVLDLVRAEESLRGGDRGAASPHLMHAQEIVLELRASLDESSNWSGTAGLTALYSFIIKELISANIRGDIEKVASCRGLVEPLRDAWREAAVAASAAASAADAAAAGVPVGSRVG